MDILTTYDLSVGYTEGKKPDVVLSDVKLSLPEATVTVLIGANGTGKSTLLRTLSGVQKPLGGKIEICGTDIREMPVRERARCIALVYTDRNGGAGLTVRELVGLGRQPYTGFLGRMSAEDRQITEEAMQSVGIITKADSYVGRLSDGERQKVMIAKAIAQQTELIVLDEPTSYLDVASRLEIMQLLGRLAHEERKTVLLSTHDIAPALSIADRLWIVDRTTRSVAEGFRDDMTACGAMDRVFPDRNISFDTTSNDFRLIDSGGKS